MCVFAPNPLGVVGGDLKAMLRQKQTIFTFKLKKVRKINRTFSYDLNQIPYDFIVEMKNRFKGLSGSLKIYGWRFVTLYTSWSPKPSPRKTNVRKKGGYLRRP